jgi:hypothetical protein
MAMEYLKRKLGRGSRGPTPSAGAGGPAEGPAAGGAAISLEKVQQSAPGLVSLYKSAAVSLEKRSLTGLRAAVYLVLDRSGSMKEFYRSGSVQRLAEQVLGLAAHFDDDGIVPVVFFSTGIDGVHEVSLDNHTGRINQLHESMGHMGRTNYAAAMQAVVEHYRASGAVDPAYVVFQTDGGPINKGEAERALCEASTLPIFWQFVGFGEDRFAFLRKLDDLPVPEKRAVDNAGFFAAGSAPQSIPDSELYDKLMSEFPEWLEAAEKAGILT